MNFRASRTGGKGAFTLIEVIIATSILAFLMVVLHQFFWASSSAWKKGNERLKIYQNARVCLDTMSREIRCALISRGNSRLVFKGEKDALSYISTLNKPDERDEFDLCEIGYSLSSQDEVLRRIKVHLNSFPGGGGATAVLASNISELSFLYDSGDAWKERWDSTQGTPDDTTDDYLPQAVKITILAQDEQRRESPLLVSTIVTILTGGK